MPRIPLEEKRPEQNRKESPDWLRNGSAEGTRIASIASQLSPEDLEQLRQYIDRHHPKLFQ